MSEPEIKESRPEEIPPPEPTVPTSTEIGLQRWKPNFVRGKNFAMLIFASRGGGKSHLTEYLLKYHLRDKYDSFIVFSQSLDSLNEYKSILPGDLFFDEFNSDMIFELFKLNKKRMADNLPKIQYLLVFDDQISNKQRYDDSLLQIFTRGRHVGVSIIFISQSLVYANASWRNNADVIISLKQNSTQARKAIRDNIFSGSINLPDNVKENKFYENLMRKYMSIPGDALVLDFEKSSFDNLFWFRAPDMKNEKEDELTFKETDNLPVIMKEVNNPSNDDEDGGLCKII